MRIATLAASGLLLSSGLVQADVAQVGQQAVADWQHAASRFAAAVAAACPAAPQTIDPAALAGVQDDFRNLVLGWQTAQPWLVGPDLPVDLASHVWFWPDPHGSAGRQIDRSVAAGEPVGIAGHGLGTAEAILYPKGAAVRVVDAESCGLLQDVGAFQADLATINAKAFAARMLPDRDRVRLLVTSMRDTLDTVSQAKLGRPLGFDIDTARGRRAEAWRSGLSLDLVAAALHAVKAMYLPPAGVEDELAQVAEGDILSQKLSEQFAATEAALGTIALPLDEAVSDPAARRSVETLLREVQQQRLLVVERLAPALGVSLGFNALDGD